MNNHFVLIKHAGHDTNGHSISATDSIKALFNAGMWPLFERTRCKNMVAPGGKILAYTAGHKKDSGMVIGMADIDAVLPWGRKFESRYPLSLDGVADKVLVLKNCKLFDTPVKVKEVISQTSFAPQNSAKWGVCFMGGARSLIESDYRILSGQNEAALEPVV
jgi:hypothetical protein